MAIAHNSISNNAKMFSAYSFIKRPPKWAFNMGLFAIEAALCTTPATTLVAGIVALYFGGSLFKSGHAESFRYRQESPETTKPAFRAKVSLWGGIALIASCPISLAHGSRFMDDNEAKLQTAQTAMDRAVQYDLSLGKPTSSHSEIIKYHDAFSFWWAGAKDKKVASFGQVTSPPVRSVQAIISGQTLTIPLVAAP